MRYIVRCKSVAAAPPRRAGGHSPRDHRPRRSSYPPVHSGAARSRGRPALPATAVGGGPQRHPSTAPPPPHAGGHSPRDHGRRRSSCPPVHSGSAPSRGRPRPPGPPSGAVGLRGSRLARNHDTESCRAALREARAARVAPKQRKNAHLRLRCHPWVIWLPRCSWWESGQKHFSPSSGSQCMWLQVVHATPPTHPPSR